MLVRAAKSSFCGLHEVAKILTWSVSKKQNFHSTCQNDYYSDYNRNRNRRRFPRRKWEMSFPELETKKEFKLEDLKNFERNFYAPHHNVLNRAESEVKNFYDAHDIKIFGNNFQKCPNPIFTFDELDLPSETLNIIRNLNYSEPTPIQSQTWPLALSGFNMVGIARTGSGKTLGFVLPGLIHIRHQPPLEEGDGPVALIISPTRELAQQTEGVILPFAKSYSFKTACVFGGIRKEHQSSLLEGAHVCVGTPGRLIDFLRSDTLNLNRCTFCVLDEADRLLNMGFEPQIRAIMNKMRPDSQILMWSATWPKEVQHLAADYLKDYIGVKFGSSDLSTNPNIIQHIHVCQQHEKFNLLLKLLEGISEKENSKTLIFAQMKSTVTRLYGFLRKNGYRAVYLHGDKSQHHRNHSLQLFRSGTVQILVGTAVVGRGLDISDIGYVINFDFPNEVEDYVHIIGRTGRVNNQGTAHTFFTQEDARCAKELINVLNQTNQEVNPELMNFTKDKRKYHFNRY